MVPTDNSLVTKPEVEPDSVVSSRSIKVMVKDPVSAVSVKCDPNPDRTVSKHTFVWSQKRGFHHKAPKGEIQRAYSPWQLQYLKITHSLLHFYLENLLCSQKHRSSLLGKMSGLF